MIRLAVTTDIKRLAELFTNEPFLLGNADDFYTEDDILQYLSCETKRFFVYEKEKAVVGALLIDLLLLSREIHIAILVVDKAWQGRGIGQEFMDHVGNLAKTHGITLLSSFTEETNARMMHVFEKNGYAKGKSFVYYAKVLKP